MRPSDTLFEPSNRVERTGLKSITIAHVVATGPHLERDRIVHVGAIRVTRDGPPEARDWVCNPGVPLTHRQLEASGIAPETGHRTWAEQRPEVEAFLADTDVLLVFDADRQEPWFSDVILSDVRRPPRIVDLAHAASFFLPDQPIIDARQLIARSGSPQGPVVPPVLVAMRDLLDELLQALTPSRHGEERDWTRWLTHWALRDSIAFHPFGDLLRMAEQSQHFYWDDTEPDISQTPGELPAVDVLTRGIVTGECARLAARCGGDSSPSKPQATAAPSIESVYARLSVELDGFSPRPAQDQYSAFCADAFARGGHYAVEAGTGTGKTLGYLIPACSRVLQDPESRVIIATATRNLQDQVLAELHRLTGIGPFSGIRGVVVKGKRNYLCASSLADSFSSLSGSADLGERLAWLALFVRLDRCLGDLEGLPEALRVRYPSLERLVPEVEAQSNCTRDNCRLGYGCVYPKTIERAKKAHIVVTNQHKLLSLPPDIVEPADVCIIDEADQFPDNFRSSMERALSSSELERALMQKLVGLRDGDRRGFIDLLFERMETENRNGRHLESPAELARNLDRLRSARNAVLDVRESMGVIRSMLDGRAGWAIRWQQIDEDTLTDLTGQIQQAGDRIVDTATALRRVRDSERYADATLPDVGRRREALEQEALRLERYIAEAEGYGAVAADLPEAVGEPEWIHTAECSPWSWTLTRTPYDIGGLMEEAVFASFESVLFTSATLFVNDSSAFFRSELFHADPFDGERQIASPFPFQDHCHAGVTAFLPRYNFQAPAARQAEWMDAMANAVTRIAVAFEGRTLVLTTSRKDVSDLAARIRDPLAAQDIELLLQTGASRAEIQSFRYAEHTVLMGVDRLWTGVDFPGETLSCVIVVRSPNPNLGRPDVQHRREHDPDFWNGYYRNAARLRMKQGFGRLVRQESDRGLFVVLDARLSRDPRFRPILKELPITPVIYKDPRGGLDAMIEQGLAVAGL